MFTGQVNEKGLNMKNRVFSTIVAGFIALPAWAEAPITPSETPVTIAYEQVCGDISLSVYFESNSAELSSMSRLALEASLDQIQADCAVTEIQTTTLSNDTVSDGDNLTLSQARSESVLESVAAAGVWAANVQSDIVINRVNNRPDTAHTPLARRVEIQIHTAKAITS